LFTYLHLAANKELTLVLMKSGITAVAYETIEVNRHLPLLEPMSEIAGRMSILVGGYFLAKHCGGSGVLLGGVPGVLPGRVVVLGGSSGINAARMTTGLGRTLRF
jgi:alanine dehydrogenase